ncbi:MAG: hypothetical protein PHW41_02925 [Eubacteriales bacterium]|nr:hypothetical protein [Eubacteriales bacterium]
MNLIGLPLDRATELLSNAGIVFSAEETRSKKGVEGGMDARIVRQRTNTDGSLSLLYALFRTEPLQEDTQPPHSINEK